MTKVSVFDLSNAADKQPDKELKPIEFTTFINDNYEDFESSFVMPDAFDNIVRLFKASSGDYDVIMAWDNGNEPNLFKGHWNDGVVA